MELEGRVALITGAGRSIGREIALGFAAEGARLVLNATTDKSSLEPSEALCAAKGAEVRRAAGDVLDRRSFETDMMTQHGPLSESIATPMRTRVAMGRFMKPQELVPLAVCLASSDSDGVTGQSIVLDGGKVFV